MTNRTEHTEQVNVQAQSTAPIERAALDSMTDGIVISDAAGQVVLINRSAARILRADPRLGEEIRSTPYSSPVPPISIPR